MRVCQEGMASVRVRVPQRQPPIPNLAQGEASEGVELLGEVPSGEVCPVQKDGLEEGQDQKPEEGNSQQVAHDGHTIIAHDRVWYNLRVMRALVTGASGFIGYHVARRLTREGVQVRALVRGGRTPRYLEDLGVEVVQGDLLDPESLGRAVQGCGWVFHVAGLYSLWERDSRVFYDVNVVGTRHVLAACQEVGVERLVYTSTVAALGRRSDGLPADESIRFNLWDEADHYMRSKYLAEEEVLAAAREGVPVVVVCPSSPVGSHDFRPTPTGRPILDIMRRRMPVYVDGVMNVVDVEDVAEGHLLAVIRGRVGEKYILGHQNMALGEFFRLVAEVAGTPAPPIRLPYPVALAASRGMVGAAHLLGIRPLATPRLVRRLHLGLGVDPSKAVRELGLPQTPVREAVRKAVAWFRAAGYA